MTNDRELPEGLDPDILERLVTVEVHTANIEKMRHAASARHFEFLSDEPPKLGGDDEYPAPLQYLLGGIGL